MDGWNTTFLLGRPIFRGYVSFREGRPDFFGINSHVLFEQDQADEPSDVGQSRPDDGSRRPVGAKKHGLF